MKNEFCCEDFDTGQPPEECVVAAIAFSPLLCAPGNKPADGMTEIFFWK